MAGVLSSKVLQLRFMQRASEKEKRAQTAAEQADKDDEAHWMVAGAAQRCVVIAEGSCLASSNGRFSFTGTDRVEDGGAGQREGAAEPSTEGIDVDDTEMAARLAKKRAQPPGAGQSKRRRGGGSGGRGGGVQDGRRHGKSGKKS